MARILVIDDDADFAESIKALMKSFFKDASVSVAYSGREGLSAARAQLPDVILLDLGLPDIDGFEISQSLKSDERTSTIPVVMLTGIGLDSTVKIKALELGADTFLSKPFDPGELAAQVRAMLRMKEAEDRLKEENLRLKNLNEQLGQEVEQRMAAENDLRMHREELESTVADRTAELNLLQEINTAVNTGRPLDEVLKMITEGFKRIFDYDVCDIYKYHPESNELEMMAYTMDYKSIEWIQTLTGIRMMGHRFRMEEGFFFDRVLKSPHALITSDMVNGFKEFVDNKYIKSLTPLIVKYLGYKAAMRSRLVVGGEVIGVIGVARKGDIHEDEAESLGRFASQVAVAFHKAQTEDALKREYAFRRAVEDSLTSGITIVALDGTMIYVNPAFCKMVGFGHDEIVGLKPPFPHWPPAEAEKTKRQLMKALQSGTLPENLELKYRRKDGRLIDVFINSTFLKDEGGKTVGVLASIIDITERKSLEKQVLVASEEERQSIGHDLHDGVGQYLTGTAFIAKALEDKLRKRSMPEAEDMSMVVSNLNEAIGKVRRLAKGVAPVQVSSDKCCVLFTEISDYAEDVLGLRSTFHCDEAITLNDKTTLGQMYMISREALINAAKHSGAEEVSITLRGNGDSVCMSVEDNGSGGDVYSDSYQGGMGISIMRYRAGMIGANLEITRGKSGGTMVSCTYRRGDVENG
ncbi:response regulator [Nitrospirota bacterium]